MEKWKKFLIGGYVSIAAGLFSLCLTFIIIPLIFSVVPYHHAAIAVLLIGFGIVDDQDQFKMLKFTHFISCLLISLSLKILALSKIGSIIKHFGNQ